MNRPRIIGSYALVVLLFGSAFPAIDVAVEAAPPLLLAAGRYYCSAALLLGYASVRTEDWLPRTAGDRTAVLAGGTLLIGASGMVFVALTYTTAGVVAIVLSLIPILTVLFGWVLLPGDRPSARGLAGVGLAFVGVVLVLDPASAAPTDATVIGGGIVLLTAIVITVGTIVVSRTNHPMSVLPLTGWTMLVGATIQLVAGVAVGESLAAVRPTTPALVAFGYLVVFASAVGFVVYFHLLDELGPLQVSTTRYLTPVVAVGVSWALLDEPVRATVVVGFVVILLGFVLLENRELAAELAKYRGAAR